jgi:hypothetical protein
MYEKHRQLNCKILSWWDLYRWGLFVGWLCRLTSESYKVRKRNLKTHMWVIFSKKIGASTLKSQIINLTRHFFAFWIFAKFFLFPKRWIFYCYMCRSCECGCEPQVCPPHQEFHNKTCTCRCKNMAAMGQCLVQYNKVWLLRTVPGAV